MKKLSLLIAFLYYMAKAGEQVIYDLAFVSGVTLWAGEWTLVVNRQTASDPQVAGPWVYPYLLCSSVYFRAWLPGSMEGWSG